MTNRLQDLTDWDVTICDRCGEEIAVFAARYAGPELPTWEGATLCNECYAAELTPTATDLSEPEVLDPDMGPGWRVLVWRDNATWLWYSLGFSRTSRENVRLAPEHGDAVVQSWPDRTSCV